MKSSPSITVGRVLARWWSVGGVHQTLCLEFRQIIFVSSDKRIIFLKFSKSFYAFWKNQSVLSYAFYSSCSFYLVALAVFWSSCPLLDQVWLLSSSRQPTLRSVLVVPSSFHLKITEDSPTLCSVLGTFKALEMVHSLGPDLCFMTIFALVYLLFLL